MSRPLVQRICPIPKNQHNMRREAFLSFHIWLHPHIRDLPVRGRV